MSLISSLHNLLSAYQSGILGRMDMPEDAHPVFRNVDEKLAYFTLPMSLNYQRNSYTLRESATKTYLDPETQRVFDLASSASASRDQLQYTLTRHKVALQPNKHIQTRSLIAQTIATYWGSITKLLEAAHYDFLELQQLVQVTHKKGFPYLSGPKIFHYWSYILGEYCDISLTNREYIDIAPDTHVVQASVKLGVLTADEATTLSREEISMRRRDVLQGTGIDPIDMHSPLWFWSRNGFVYEIDA